MSELKELAWEIGYSADVSMCYNVLKGRKET